MTGTLSADSTDGVHSDGFGASDGTPPDLDSERTDGVDVLPSFDVTVEQTVVEVRDSNREIVQWRASCRGESAISDDPMAAVMGVLDEVTGGNGM